MISKKLTIAILLTFILTIAYQVLASYMTSPEGFKYPNPGNYPGQIGPGTFNDSNNVNPWWSFPGEVYVNKGLYVGEGIKIGNTNNPVAGTIRWTGNDFEGYNGTDWVSLTAGGVGQPIPGLPTIPFSGKVAFITETTTDGTIDFNGKSGIEAADEICNYEWQKYGGDPSRQFRAWISNSTVNAKDRVGNGPWYRPVPNWQGWSGGVWELIANNLSDLTDGSIGISISTSPMNSNINDNVWTGTNVDGTVADNCADWTTNCGSETCPMGPQGWQGNSGSTGTQWTISGHVYCNFHGRLYCFEI